MKINKQNIRLIKMYHEIYSNVECENLKYTHGVRRENILNDNR